MVETCLPIDEFDGSSGNEIPNERYKRSDVHQPEVATRNKTSIYGADRTNTSAFAEKKDEITRSTSSFAYRE